MNIRWIKTLCGNQCCGALWQPGVTYSKDDCWGGEGGRASRAPGRTAPLPSPCLSLHSFPVLPGSPPPFSGFSPFLLCLPCLLPTTAFVSCSRPKARVSPEFVHWKFVLSVMIFGCGVFRKWLGHNSGALMKRVSALIKEDPELPLMWGCSEKLAGYEASELRTSPDTRSARAWRMDFLASRTVLLKDICCSLSGLTPASLLLFNSHFSFRGFLFLFLSFFHFASSLLSIFSLFSTYLELSCILNWHSDLLNLSHNSLLFFQKHFVDIYIATRGFPGGSDGEESTCNARDLGSIPRSGRSPGEGKGYPLQYSGLENPMDREAGCATQSMGL